ncbi:hypothetical protein ANO14919_118750 [Xylariales sp. No.14919]|nr:hypothetical protein ANO14919_118750 [Xylariales sp. No.14919]
MIAVSVKRRRNDAKRHRCEGPRTKRGKEEKGYHMRAVLRSVDAQHGDANEGDEFKMGNRKGGSCGGDGKKKRYPIGIQG